MNINFDHYSPQFAVDVANAMSRDIDEMAMDSQSLDESAYNELWKELVDNFNTVCNIVEAHGLVLSDVVICPKYL